MRRKHPKLVRVRMTIQTDFVVENYWDEEPQKCAESATSVPNNMRDILSHAFTAGEINYQTWPVNDVFDLPPKWTLDALPFQVANHWGIPLPEKKIKEFLRKRNK